MIRIKAKETVVVAKFPLGVIIISTLSWDSHIHTITANADKLLGLLKWTCPLLTDFSVRPLCTCLWSSHSCVTPPKSGRPLTLSWMLKRNRCRGVRAGAFYARTEARCYTRNGWLACKQALRMGYSQFCFRIATGRARDRRACNGPCTIWVFRFRFWT